MCVCVYIYIYIYLSMEDNMREYFPGYMFKFMPRPECMSSNCS